VLVLDGAKARAWGQFGCRIPQEVVRDGVEDPLRSIAVPTEESLLVRHAKMRRGAFLDAVSDFGVDQILARLLETKSNESVLVLPVRRGEEILCLGVGTGPREAQSLQKSGHYEILGSKLSDAVEIVRLRKRILEV
jgi:hypothetical protein